MADLVLHHCCNNDRVTVLTSTTTQSTDSSVFFNETFEESPETFLLDCVDVACMFSPMDGNNKGVSTQTAVNCLADVSPLWNTIWDDMTSCLDLFNPCVYLYCGRGCAFFSQSVYYFMDLEFVTIV